MLCEPVESESELDPELENSQERSISSEISCNSVHLAMNSPAVTPFTFFNSSTKLTNVNSFFSATVISASSTVLA